MAHVVKVGRAPRCGFESEHAVFLLLGNKSPLLTSSLSSLGGQGTTLWIIIIKTVETPVRVWAQALLFFSS